MWHLCSWERIHSLKNRDAAQAFHGQKKKKCTIFYQFVDEAFLIDHAGSLTADQLPYDRRHMDYGDLYVMDWELRWTFVMTHEEKCGLTSSEYNKHPSGRGWMFVSDLIPLLFYFFELKQ
ncbi:DUF4275 family protein [Metabacillus sp. 113a]|uniref:DUF4275 family protein n=1 Tax=Metabacillus sp. 113a TaxID=3404706 RepID=UPI003CF6E1FF